MHLVCHSEFSEVCLGYAVRASFTKQLSKNLGFSFLSEKFTLIPYYIILRLNLRYVMKLAPGAQGG